MLFSPSSFGDHGFSVESNRLVFGTGTLTEIGAHARALGLTRVLLVADPRITAELVFDKVASSLRIAKIEVEVFSEVSVEPTLASVELAGRVARDAKVDGLVSLGGGSTMDTAKLANLLSTHAIPLNALLAPPFGTGRPIPGPLKPHIACPTTFGTAAETTGIATFELPEFHAKTALVSSHLRPSLGIVDPAALRTLPPLAVAANGFDLLSHSIESFTARPFHQRPAPADPSARPVTQGANPLADLGCLAALRILSTHLAAAVAGDQAAREQLMFAGLLAGTVFGNAGNHLPHALSYPISGNPRGWRAVGYPQDHALVPHGIAVALGAPAAFRRLGAAASKRFLQVAVAVGLEDVAEAEAGAAVAEAVTALLRQTGLPNGLSALGFGDADVPALAQGALAQSRLIDNAPIPLTATEIEEVVRDSLILWPSEDQHA